MTFNSLNFFLFFPAAAMLYFLVPQKYQWVFLLISSYFFYLFANMKFGFFLISTTATTFFAAKALGAVSDYQKITLLQNKGVFSKEQAKECKAICKSRKKRIVAAVVILNFGILAFLKYFNFLSANFNFFAKSIHSSAGLPVLKLILPLGISFYTFQAMGYLIDVYRGKYPPEQNPAKLALFLSFFPQIMEGPIGRYDDLAHQLYEPHEFDYDNAKYGLQLMLWGYFKKVVIADRAGILVNTVYSSYQSYSGFQLAITAVVYAIQIYADFSGYIDIATGAAQFMGIRLAQNFNRPYFSKTVSEFWRRWHITLGTWFKDYLFYPLSLSKAGLNLGKFGRKHFHADFAKNLPAIFGLSIVWLTTGLWHGADWHYIVYGVYYGLLIILSMLCKPVFEKINNRLNVHPEQFGWKLFRVARTFFLVCLGFILFRADNLPTAFGVMRSIFLMSRPAVGTSLLNGDFTKTDLLFFVLSTGILLAVSLLQRKMNLRETLAQKSTAVRWAVYCTAALSVVFLGVLSSNDPTQFIYFQF
ncbi:MBOAT family O-acyltransferase [Caproiciproducens galactitolivorans]|uniref:MBOAT family protein n=1 Tax=Caproiciproducens galactitolivorans TaxID=642589 RepID=A0ABT4BT21_9FIRM|nr:MBOAT family O-acyltransferase [Caproiciproducens galactitolivorans]MCY1714051.1 MBOAT family protein [Caproiciproducens galactitolivorans]